MQLSRNFEDIIFFIQPKRSDFGIAEENYPCVLVPYGLRGLISNIIFRDFAFPVDSFSL